MLTLLQFLDARKPRPKVLKGVRYNAGISTKYYKDLRALLNWVFKEFERTVVAGLSTREMERKTESMIYDESPNERYKKRLAEFNKKLRGKLSRKQIEKLVRRSLQTADSYTRREFNRKLKSFGLDLTKGEEGKKFSSYMSTAVEENVQLVTNLVAEEAHRLKSTILRGMREGIPSSRLARGLEKDLGISKRRAALIARTETHKVTQQLADYRAQELGLTKARWRAVMDNRTSDQHARFNGREFDMRKGLWDPKTRTYNWPGRRPNCRCWSEYLIPGV